MSHAPPSRLARHAVGASTVIAATISIATISTATDGSLREVPRVLKRALGIRCCMASLGGHGVAHHLGPARRVGSAVTTAVALEHRLRAADPRPTAQAAAKIILTPFSATTSGGPLLYRRENVAGKWGSHLSSNAAWQLIIMPYNLMRHF